MQYKSNQKRDSFIYFFLIRMQSFHSYPQTREWGQLLSPPNPQILIKHSGFSLLPHHLSSESSKLEQLKLFRMQKQLEHTIEEAKEQQTLMMELFESMAQLEKGEEKKLKKCKRRCPEDIVIHHHCPHQHCSRFYSSDSALKRHIRLKHDQFGDDPPEKYHTLHPQPELWSQLYFNGDESEIQQNVKEKMTKKRGSISIEVGGS